MKDLYDGKARAKVHADHAPRLKRILTALDEATHPTEMDLPGFRLHPLKGAARGVFAVSVSGNYRVTFRFDGPHAFDVDYTDYH